MNTMERFIEATLPVLKEMLMGTGITASYWRTEEGGKVRLMLDFCSSLSFSEGSARTPEDWADEVRALIRSHLDVLGDAAAGKSRFAPVAARIKMPGEMAIDV